MTPKTKKTTMKNRVTRRGKLLGAYIPMGLHNAISQWISRDPERDYASFLRTAAREKLKQDGIPFDEFLPTR